MINEKRKIGRLRFLPDVLASLQKIERNSVKTGARVPRGFYFSPLEDGGVQVKVSDAHVLATVRIPHSTLEEPFFLPPMSQKEISLLPKHCDVFLETWREGLRVCLENENGVLTFPAKKGLSYPDLSELIESYKKADLVLEVRVSVHVLEKIADHFKRFKYKNDADYKPVILRFTGAEDLFLVRAMWDAELGVDSLVVAMPMTTPRGS